MSRVEDRKPIARPANQPSAQDLERIRTYRSEPLKAIRATLQKVNDANLSAAIDHLPENMRGPAEARIREALTHYVRPASDFLRSLPPKEELARLFTALDYHAAEMWRLLLALDELPVAWPPADTIPEAVRWELGWTPEERAELRVRLLDIARRARTLRGRVSATAPKDEAEAARGGRPRDWRMFSLLSDLDPLLTNVRNQAAFVQACLAAIGEEKKLDTIKRALTRYRDTVITRDETSVQ